MASADNEVTTTKPENHSGTYEFTVQRKKYRLPAFHDLATKVPNSVWMAAYCDPKNEQKSMRLIWSAFELANIPDATREVLDSLPPEEFIKHVVAWFELQNEDGVTSGESSGSASN